MSDVVSGLLAKLDEIEQEANEGHSLGCSSTDPCYEPPYEDGPDYGRCDCRQQLTLRLCRAHRDILGMHDRTKRLLDQANERVLQQVMDGTVATRQEQRDFDSLHVEEAVLQEVIEALAVGLGVEEQSSE